MNIYEQYGYNKTSYEAGVWIEIPGDPKPFEVQIRGLNSRAATRAAAKALDRYDPTGERDFADNPLMDTEDFDVEVYMMSHGVIVDWRGDNWLDPDTLEPMSFTPENAERLLTKAGGICRRIKHRAQRLQTFQDKATKAAAKNSSRRSGSRRTGSASTSTDTSSNGQASAPGR